MAFRFSDYVALASAMKKELPDDVNDPGLKDGAAQAKLRTAVSRAYYGAFREAFFFARDEDKLAVFRDESRKKTEDHALLIQIYQSKSDSARKLIADKLWLLRKKRNTFDYDFDPQFVRPYEVLIMLNEAQAVLAALDTLRAKAARKANR